MSIKETFLFKIKKITKNKTLSETESKFKSRKEVADRLKKGENAGNCRKHCDYVNELYVGMVEQATRVTVDEDGVAAAGYVVVMKPGSPMPPTEEVDFVLDRPFLFTITNSANIPLFAGVVNNP